MTKKAIKEIVTNGERYIIRGHKNPAPTQESMKYSVKLKVPQKHTCRYLSFYSAQNVSLALKYLSANQLQNC